MFCAVTFTRKAAVLLVCCLVVPSAAQVQNFTDIKPSPQQVAWQDLEFGVIIHLRFLFVAGDTNRLQRQEQRMGKRPG